jgi:16S rRNA processing protein RimM
MLNNDYFSIGYISKTRGLKGELQLYLEVDNPQDYKNMESLFLEINQKPVPFFITKLLIQKNIVYIYIEDVDHIDKAKPLVGKAAYVHQKNKPANTNEDSHKVLIGYTVHDEQLGELGIINAIQELPSQLIANMMYQNKEVLFPLNDQFVTSIDKKNKTIHVNLPDGLIDLYLSN